MARIPKEIKRDLSERLLPNGKRQIALRKGERIVLQREQRVETAVAMFLDLEKNWTWKQIAEALGVSIVTLKKITKSQAFIDRYNEHFADLGHDPRLKASQAALVDMLPLAIRQLKNLIELPTSPAVKLNAIKEVIRLNGIQPQGAGMSDNAEFASFLKKAGVNVENATINVSLPEEYQNAINNYVDGKFEEIPVLKTGIVRATRSEGSDESEEA